MTCHALRCFTHRRSGSDFLNAVTVMSDFRVSVKALTRWALPPENRIAGAGARSNRYHRNGLKPSAVRQLQTARLRSTDQPDTSDGKYG